MFYTDVETNLPPDLKEESVLCFEAAVANRMNIGDAIKKVEEDVLSKCNEEFKGKRFKGFIKFNYDTNMIAIQVFSLLQFEYKTCAFIVFIYINPCSYVYHIRILCLQINKFAGGNCNFSAGIGTTTRVCPDPFMGALNDQMAQFKKYRP